MADPKEMAGGVVLSPHFTTLQYEGGRECCSQGEGQGGGTVTTFHHIAI